ncbi:hypothetical protein SLE2022_338530 [Rubroshorea leprosula]
MSAAVAAAAAAACSSSNSSYRNEGDRFASSSQPSMPPSLLLMNLRNDVTGYGAPSAYTRGTTVRRWLSRPAATSSSSLNTPTNSAKPNSTLTTASSSSTRTHTRCPSARDLSSKTGAAWMHSSAD